VVNAEALEVDLAAEVVVADVAVVEEEVVEVEEEVVKKERKNGFQSQNWDDL
jgi:hypothetical protein